MGDIRIFISSVQKEFAAERKDLAKYIREDALLGRFFSPFIFEEMPAYDGSAQQVYLSEVGHCDIYLGVFGHDYGNVDKDGVSPTEREFDCATEKSKTRLIFIKRLEKRDDKESALVKKAESCVVRKSFADYDEFRTAVYAALVRYLEDNEYLRLLPFDATLHPTATLEDIDETILEAFVETARKKRSFPLSYSVGMERILTHLQLYSNGRLTNSALLLFAKDPQKFFPTSEVKCVQFYTNVISKPLASYQIYRGNVFEMVDNAVSFVMSHIDARVGARDEKVEVNVDFELPLKSVTESIVNAVSHRNYASNGSVQVMLFPDRLEVWNPGHLPKEITIEDLVKPHTSFPVNPLLANGVYMMGYIERLGTGTSDIVEECLKAGLPQPQFIQDSNFRSVIWRKNVHSSAENVHSSGENAPSSGENAPSSCQNTPSSGENVPSSNGRSTKLSAKEKAVLAFCQDYAHSAQEIFEHIGLQNTSRTRLRYITQLVMAGLLVPTTEKANDPKRKYIAKK